MVLDKHQENLQQEYDRWRLNMEANNKPEWMIDCSYDLARNSFSMFCGMDRTIGIGEMLTYEANYNKRFQKE